MRLLFKNEEVQVENESDYDTAVDMVHYEYHESNYTFEDPRTGMEITFHKTFTSTTHSYLEPDFDLLEETGETVYESHSDHSNDSQSTNYRVSISQLNKIPEMTRNDFKNYHAFLNDENIINELSYEDAMTVSHYQDFIMGGMEEPNYLSYSAKEMKKLFTFLSNTSFKPGMSYDIVFDKQLGDELEQAIKDRQVTLSQNSSIRVNNQCEEAHFNLSYKLNELFNELMIQLKDEWKEKDEIQISARFKM